MTDTERKRKTATVDAMIGILRGYDELMVLYPEDRRLFADVTPILRAVSKLQKELYEDRVAAAEALGVRVR